MLTIRIKIIIAFTILTLLLSACGSKPPEFTKIKVKSDRYGVLLESTKRSELKILERIIHEKVEDPNAGPEFKYLVDITKDGKTIRWQYSIDGYIRNYEVTNSMIYLLKDVALFNRTTHIKN